MSDIISKVLRLMLAVCLVVGLAPNIALAAEAPQAEPAASVSNNAPPSDDEAAAQAEDAQEEAIQSSSSSKKASSRSTSVSESDLTPTIKVQPQPVKCKQGDQVDDLKVQAQRPTKDPGASGTLTYQWYVSDNEALNGAYAIKGETYSSLPVDSSNEGINYYYCEVTNTYEGVSSSVNSEAVMVNITSIYEAATPQIVAQPQSFTVAFGDKPDDEMAVVAKVEGNGAGELTYQWYKSSNPDGSDAVAIDGATNNYWDPSVITTLGTTYVYCVVTNHFNGITETADARSDIATYVLEDTVSVKSPEDLIEIRDKVNNDGVTYEGVTILIENDIDLTAADSDWAPIGKNYSAIFSGVIDGGFHTIKLKSTQGGLLGYMNKGGVNNLYLEGNIELGPSGRFSSYTGGLVCNLNVDAEVSFNNVITSISVTGEMGSGKYYGGLVGYVYGYSALIEFNGCANKGDMHFDDGYGYVGGLFGYVYSTSTSSKRVTVKNCYNSGNITAGGASSSTRAAGICGYASNAYLTIQNSYNSGYMKNNAEDDPYTYTLSNNGAVSNSFALEGSAVNNTSGCTILSESEMKEGLQEKLGDSFISVNDGFPELKWDLCRSGLPIILTNPESASYQSNENIAPLTVEAKVVTPSTSLAYQWFMQKVGENAAPIQGATSTSYTPQRIEGGAVTYYCEVTSTTSDGNKLSTQTAKAEIVCFSGIGAATPAITKQPEALKINMADTGTLSVEAEVSGPGSGQLTYQWYWTSSLGSSLIFTPSGDDAKQASFEPYPNYIPNGETRYFFCEVTNNYEPGNAATVRSEVVEVTIDASVYIYTADDFIAFRDFANSNSTSGINYYLMADIDLTEKEDDWTPIGNTTSHPFEGSFDGCYHTLKFRSTTGGLFGYFYGTGIKNLYVEGSLELDYASGTSDYVGTVINWLNKSGFEMKNVISNVNITGTLASPFGYLGGLVGYLRSTPAKFTQCANKGDIKMDNSWGYVGGLFGCESAGASASLEVTDCYNSGNITAGGTSNYPIGGICGRCSYGALTLTNCYNSGQISTVGNVVNCTYDFGSNILRMSNCYSLAGCAYNTHANSTVVSVSEMEQLADKLGSAYENVPNGYPKLYFEGRADAYVQTDMEDLYYTVGDDARTWTAELNMANPAYAIQGSSISYKWYKSQDDQIDEDDELVGTESSFAPSTEEASAYYYYCICDLSWKDSSDADKSESFFSDVCKVEVGDTAASPISIVQRINGEEAESASCEIYEDIDFTIEASFTQPNWYTGDLVYQWFKSSDANMEDEVPIEGATESSLTTAFDSLGKTYIRCSIKNGVSLAVTKTPVIEIEVAEPYISNAEDLAKLAKNVNEKGFTYAGVTVNQTQDIDLSSICGEGKGSWTPIGTTYSVVSKSFGGTYNGNGYRIDNLYIADDSDTTVEYRALFGGLCNAVIKNLTVSGYVGGANRYQYVGGVGAYGPATYENVVNECNIGGITAYAAGVASYSGTFKNCANKGNVQVSAISQACGISANGSYPEFYNCYNTGNISNTYSTTCAACGITNDANVINGCYNIGEISAPNAYPISKYFRGSNGVGNFAIEAYYPAVDPSSSLYAPFSYISEFEFSSPEVVNAMNRACGSNAFIASAPLPMLYFESGKGSPIVSSYKRLDASFVQGDRPATVSVDASTPEGYPGELSYQWYMTKNKDLSDAAPIEGETSSSYLAQTSQMPSGTNYVYCLVTNTTDEGQASIKTCLSRYVITSTIDAAEPQIALHPKSATYNNSETDKAVPLTVSLKTEVGPGLGEFSYQWYKSDSSNVISAEPVIGANDPTFIPDISSTGCAYYYCLITNTFEGIKTSSTCSDVAEIVVYSDDSAAPVIQTYSAGDIIFSQNGQNENTTIQVEASLPSGKPANEGVLSIKWYRSDDADGANAQEIENANEDSFTFDVTEDANSLDRRAYYYFAIVTNSFYVGQVLCTSSIRSEMLHVDTVSNVSAAFPVSKVLSSESSYIQGDKATPLTVRLTSFANDESGKEEINDGIGVVKGQWYRSSDDAVNTLNDDIAVGDIFETGATDSNIPIDFNLALPTTGYDGTWYYYCKFTNTYENLKVAEGFSNTVGIKVEPKYNIYTVDDFNEFMGKIGTYFDGSYFTCDGYTVALHNDIDLGGESSPYILHRNTYSYKFAGIFDGNGHTISGMYATYGTNRDLYMSLFGCTIGATIRNLTVEGTIDATAHLNGIYRTYEFYVGGIVGYATNTVFENCKSLVDISCCDNYVGSSSINRANGIGGIAGMARMTTVDNNPRIINCSYEGTIDAHTSTTRTTCSTGGIVGHVNGVPINSCYAKADLYGNYVGGIVGDFTGNASVSNCYFDGTCGHSNTFTSNSTPGGIASGIGAYQYQYSNNYYNVSKISVDCGTQSDPDNNKGLSDSVMKSVDFVNLLNDGGGKYVSKPASTPILEWEAKDAPVASAFITREIGANALLSLGDEPSSMSVSASLPSGASGSLSYQWYSGSMPYAFDAIALSNGASPSFTPDISEMQPDDIQYFWCEITNTFNGATAVTKSSPYYIWIKSDTPASQPTIVKQPESYQYEYGVTVSDYMSIEVNEAALEYTDEGVTYQWYTTSDPTDVPKTLEDVESAKWQSRTISGATSSNYRNTTIAKRDAGKHYFLCVVTNTYQETKKSIIVSNVACIDVADEVIISTPEEFQAMRGSSGPTYENVTVKVTNDLMVNGWTLWSIGYGSYYPFKGIFDGQGHTITITGTWNSASYPIFNYVEDALIKDVTFKGTQTGDTTSMCMYSTGSTFINVGCEINMSYSSSAIRDGSGFVNTVYPSKTGKRDNRFINCYSKSSVYNSVNRYSYDAKYGGFVYSVQEGSNALFEGCYFDGSFEATYTAGSTATIGSFAVDIASDTVIRSCYGAINLIKTPGINDVAVAGISNIPEGAQIYNSYTANTVPSGNEDLWIKDNPQMPSFDALESQGISSKSAALNRDGVDAFVDGAVNPELVWQASKAAGCSIDPISDQKYTGSAINPSVVVKKEGAIVDPSNYTVKYANNVEIGLGYAYVSFIDGTVLSASFNIVGEDFSGTVCAPIPLQTYTSMPVCPNKDVVLTLNGRTLVEGQDYRLQYTNNVNVGTATVEIIGLGLYKGQSMQAQFEIDGTIDPVVEISTAEELMQLSEDVAAGMTTKDRTFLLTQDIDLSSVCGSDINGKEISWKPIGTKPESILNGYASNAFCGVFDGQGHQISNIYTGSSTTEAALFGYTLNATIKNISLSGNLYGSSNAAGYALYPWKTTLMNLVNEADIKGKSYAGGIVAQIGYYFAGSSSATSGLTQIINCVNKGSVDTTYSSETYGTPIAGYAGGIAAYKGSSSGYTVVLENCYNAGSLTGRYVGGLIGYFYPGGADEIQSVTNCFNIGKMFVNCTLTSTWGQLSGSIPSSSHSFGTINNNYYLENNVELLYEDNEYSHTEYSAIGMNSQTEEQMKSNNFVDLLNQGGTTNYVPVENDFPRLAFEDAAFASEKDITITGIKDMPWTGDAIELDGITVSDKDGELVEGDDYTVEYSDNTDMGTASITFNFKGKYYETITKHFEITNPAISVDELEVSEIAPQMHKGAPVMPEVAVAYVAPSGKKIALQQVIDYNLSYENNDAPGTASVKITGIGKFAGTKTVEFDINSISLGDGTDPAEGVTAEVYGGWFYTGNEICPIPVVKYGDETLTAGTDFTCTYENNVGTPKESSKASITVTAAGYYVGSFKLEFEIQKPSFGGEGSSVTIDPIEPQQFTGDQICPEVTFRVNGEEVSGEAFEVSYGENVNVSTGGSITITANDKELYGEGSITSSFQILPLDFTDIVEVVEATAEEEAYTGEPIYVSDIKAMVNDTELAYGTDYEVDPLGYENNINAGEATVTIVGTGNYTGTAKGTYIINKADASEAVVNADAATYTGSAVEPAGHVTFNGEDVTDSFTFAYENNVNAGNATIRAIPNEDCNFDPDTSTSNIFVIEKANGPVVRGVAMTSETIEGYTKDGTIQGVTAQMEWQTSGGADAWTAIEGDAITGLSAGKYDVRYAESDNTYAGTVKTVTVSASNKQVTTLSITSASVALGSVQYGATAAKSAVVTNAGNIRQTNIKVTSSNPAILASVNATSVDPGKTFSMTASAARANVGTYTSTVKVTSAENPTGVTFNVTLTVTAKPVANLTVAGVANKTYNGAAQTQAPAITDGSTALTLNKDYSLSYANNVNAGTATMTITGMGNYSGSRTVNFSIGAQAAAATVTLNKTQMTYTGKALAPVVTVKVGATTLTTASYTVALANNIKPGQATVKVTLKGNYTGSGSATFKIIPKKMTIKAPVAAKKALTVKWTKDANVTGYEILVATNSGFTKNKKTVKVTKASTTSKKVTGLKAKTKYYVKIRSYKTVGSTKLYSAWSSSKNKKTK